jgi:hypothetical protein
MAIPVTVQPLKSARMRNLTGGAEEDYAATAQEVLMGGGWDRAAACALNSKDMCRPLLDIMYFQREEQRIRAQTRKSTSTSFRAWAL